MLLFKVFRPFSRKSELNLDRANAACTGHRPFAFNDMPFFPPIVTEFCAHLFSKIVSFCVTVGAFAVYPFVSLRKCKF